MLMANLIAKHRSACGNTCCARRPPNKPKAKEAPKTVLLRKGKPQQRIETVERTYPKSEVIGLPSLPPILKGRLVGDITI